jgi:protein gp37
MRNSKIEWTDHTYNPWVGCVNVSPACDSCYAEMMAARLANKWASGHGVELATAKVWGKDSDRLIYPADSDKVREPLMWDKAAAKKGVRHRVFCSSMADVMERNPILDEPRQRLFEMIESTPNLDWLLLTKRPQEFSKFLPKAWLKNPRHNVWLLTTVESADYLWRIEAMMQAPAVVYGISAEPLLGPMTLPASFLKLGRSAWVIAGGESGRKPRPSKLEWFRGLREQCQRSGVPFHFKQWGEIGSDLVKIGKKEAGRLLDGRTWDEFPDSNLRSKAA